MIKMILLSAVKLFVNYIKYFFLTFIVLLSLLMVLFVILNIKSDFSFDFLKYFSFVNAIFNKETYVMHTKEVMQIFSIISLLVYAFMGIIKYLINKIFNLKLEVSLKNKLIILFSFITLVFFVTIFLIKYKKIDNDLYISFIAVYIFNIIVTFFYLTISTLSNWINNQIIKFTE